ncbi:nucleoside triphosphate pyrophosphatase [Dactylosporangium sp. AC04546]|uniref:Maf family protein n=1 Tax=Dactylosporangium sp. AC04546 TaxID=2862460 RepID=UPI001EE14808|nr:nucleoside triphosphate pyrophosphatase [Dactylosporangium sp. AC04546]WVK84771.1 nucleoside triphosphate pyrophosphatase [Dactylosporangium sp. AC04546]
MKTFILASASPARRRLLTSAGLSPQVIVSGVDESAVEAGDAATLAGTLAGLKARAVAATLPSAHADALVLGCDSVLAFDGEILGKPVDAADATSRWQKMRGRSGVLYTGHCLVDTGTGKEATATVGTTVHFAEASDEEIAAYVASGEPLQVAGAFTIDGLGGLFVERIEGDHGNVVGLSLPTLRNLLASIGIPVTSLW